MTESVTLERNAMIRLISKKDKNMSNGMRDMSRTPLTESEIEYVKSEIGRINSDESVFILWFCSSKRCYECWSGSGS